MVIKAFANPEYLIFFFFCKDNLVLVFLKGRYVAGEGTQLLVKPWEAGCRVVESFRAWLHSEHSLRSPNCFSSKKFFEIFIHWLGDLIPQKRTILSWRLEISDCSYPTCRTHLRALYFFFPKSRLFFSIGGRSQLTYTSPVASDKANSDPPKNVLYWSSNTPVPCFRWFTAAIAEPRVISQLKPLDLRYK